MNRRLIAISTGVVVLLAVVIAVFVSRTAVSQNASVAPTQANLKIGDVAPPFQVSSTAGFIDSADVHEPILLEVFATWCPHCQRETVTLNHMQAKYGDKVKIIGVCGSAYADEQNDPETQAHVVQFATYYKVAYPIAFDPDLTVAGKYLSGGFPTMVVINNGGRVTSISTGEVTEPDLEKRLKSVL